MFGGYNTLSQNVFISGDPAANEDYIIFVAPKACQITGVKATVTNTVAASTANYFDLALYNGGSSAGTALGVVAGTLLGTVGWAALTPNSFTITNGTMAANEVLKLRYSETGTGTFGSMLLSIDYVLGVG